VKGALRPINANRLYTDDGDNINKTSKVSFHYSKTLIMIKVTVIQKLLLCLTNKCDLLM